MRDEEQSGAHHHQPGAVQRVKGKVQGCGFSLAARRGSVVSEQQFSSSEIFSRDLLPFQNAAVQKLFRPDYR